MLQCKVMDDYIVEKILEFYELKHGELLTQKLKVGVDLKDPQYQSILDAFVAYNFEELEVWITLEGAEEYLSNKVKI